MDKKLVKELNKMLTNIYQELDIIWECIDQLEGELRERREPRANARSTRTTVKVKNLPD